MNAIPKRLTEVDDPSSGLCADFALLEARQRGLQRTLQALFREGLLRREHLIVEGPLAWLPLWSQQALLRFEGLQIGRIGDCQLLGPMAYYKTGAPARPIATASALLASVADALPGVTHEGLQRLIRELDNSMENDALCLNYRRGWARQWAAELGADQPCFLAALRGASLPNPALRLEQWGTLGHPWHPTHKTKLGLSTQEVVALSPEFQARLHVPLAAIKADRAQVAMADEGEDYRQWFARTFPQPWSQWEDALQRLGQDPAAWLPLPLHPYQAQRQIPQQFAQELAAADLLLLPDAGFAASPTMSFRTVVPEGSPELPHVKLPVSLRLTSVQRTVSPKSAVMGPRVTRLLERIIAREAGFDGRLDFLGEGVGLHYLDPNGDDDRARHLSVLFRSNPMSKRSDSLFPVPVGALFVDSPTSGRPIATELVGLAFGDHAAGAATFFERYAATVLGATLGAYLLYGIAFEAHQQNSFIMVDGGYQPAQLLVRDFGDLRVHGPTLRQAGLDLVPYRPGHTVFESDAPVRDKLLHAVMLCHLAELGLLLSRSYPLAEAQVWSILRRETEQVFDRLRPRTEPTRWENERRALLQSDWPAKSFLRMRLSDSADDLHGQMANPLKTPA